MGKLLPGLSAHLPGFDADHNDPRPLSVAEQQTVYASWLPGYARSTRMVWDEAVDPLLLKQGSSNELKDEAVRSYTDLLTARTRSGLAETDRGCVGPANAFRPPLAR